MGCPPIKAFCVKTQEWIGCLILNSSHVQTSESLQDSMERSPFVLRPAALRQRQWSPAARQQDRLAASLTCSALRPVLLRSSAMRVSTNLTAA